MIEPDGLIRLSPILWGIDRLVAGYIRETLEPLVYKFHEGTGTLPDQWGILASLRASTWDANHYLRFCVPDDDQEELEHELHLQSDSELATPLASAVQLALELVNHPNVASLEAGGLNELRSSLIVLRDSSDPNELACSAESLIEACFEFGDLYFMRLPDELLGEWGGKCFRYVLGTRDGKDVMNFATSLGGNRSSCEPSSNRQLVVDAESFSIRIGGRRPCFIGNNRLFHLLNHLASSPGKFVAFADIAEALGGDSLDRSSIPVLKFRLCQRLESNGYDDVAARIVTQPNHYAYCPDDRAIEM